MPKRTDIKKILIIGSGPIIIGQACEFDYSGTQACKALRQEGYEVILVNSNPATIMTDPEVADRTYIEPITPEFVAKVIERERPDAVLPTLGGQTGLNTAIRLVEEGVMKRFNVEMIGARYEVIKKAEDRILFRQAMEKIGLDLPRSELAKSIQDAKGIAKRIGGYPVVVRPSFTLGGTGGGICYSEAELENQVRQGLEYSLTKECLIEESVLGWKEFELEVMRDLKDNVVIICSIENFDPMGVHTGDSITVAPAQTLTDKEYQKMRDASIQVMREIGVETGGSNIQFALQPHTGRMVVIEMNPRVSRSSALASKATGFPIAKFAAKLAVGYTLDEIPNDITKQTPACFEPTIDYCVVKIPRFAFEKFPGVNDELGVQMKSVGETMAIGRTFKEALQKGLRGLETGHAGLDGDSLMNRKGQKDLASLKKELSLLIKRPSADRIYAVRDALVAGMSVNEIYDATFIDPWFLENLKEICDFEKVLSEINARPSKPNDNSLEKVLRRAKQFGFSDQQLGMLWNVDADAVRLLRTQMGIRAVFKRVDTCAGEFQAFTPYYYSTYEEEDEAEPSNKKKIMILGGGPNRIGQGIEFDYCCCQAAFALKEIGFETIMVNSNPETVSTDYDTSDRLYFEPVTFEDVLNIAEREKPDGVIVQYGGQTPLNLALGLQKAGVPIIGTSPDAIDRVEDRKRFKQLLDSLGLRQPENGTATNLKEAKEVAQKLGYPVVVRPSYVLGGRAMEIVYDDESLQQYMKVAVKASPKHPVLLDRFLEGAIEVDVDMIADGDDFVIGGVMEHIEEAGVHSGDSACVLPAHTLTKEIVQKIEHQTRLLAQEIGIKGLMNVQFAIQKDQIFVLEVNPRASRTIPFISKAIGVSLAKLAAQVMAGKKLKQLGFTQKIVPQYISVKESVLPFSRFPGVDIILGPEMRSTGEVMGIDRHFGAAFAKSQQAAGQSLPVKGTIFVSVKDSDKEEIIPIARKLAELKFSLIATEGTARVLKDHGIACTPIRKIAEGSPHILDRIRNVGLDLIINTPNGKGPMLDEGKIRSIAVSFGIPVITTLPGARAAVSGILHTINDRFDVKSIQEYHEDLLVRK